MITKQQLQTEARELRREVTVLGKQPYNALLKLPGICNRLLNLIEAMCDRLPDDPPAPSTGSREL